LVHAEKQTTHGGSMRYYVAKNKSIRTMSENLLRLLAIENDFGLNSQQIFLKFASKTQEKKSDLVHLLNKLKLNGATIGGYGATSKSTTVLNYCGIGPEILDFISDSTKEKIGTFSPGAHIPIISHDEMRANQPDYLLLFAWNHKFEIFEFEKEKLRSDTKFISYVPSVVIENLQ
jgi:methylation protein EvaC